MTETKQEVLDDITDILKMPRMAVSRGSSIPKAVFTRAAEFVGVTDGTMPETCEAVVTAARGAHSPSHDSRHTPSGGGSTVTIDGLRAMRDALRSYTPPAR